MSQPRAYPLAWPAHRPRTTPSARKPGRFKHQGSARYPSDISVAGATDRLENEIELLGGQYPLLSTNLETRLDGRPRSGQAAPHDPGACVYFSLEGRPYALACDTYTKVEQNIAALAAHINATRAITRHGVASAEDTLQAFSALPPPGGGVQTSNRSWREIMEFPPDFPGHLGLSAEGIEGAIRDRFRRLSRERHPDAKGGSAEAFTELTAARDAALLELVK